jgi:hypothetical protein
LTIEREWSLDRSDPRSLDATVVVRNTRASPATTTIVEPIPANTRVTFRPKNVAPTIDGALARITLVIASGESSEFEYTARLPRVRGLNAAARLQAIQTELSATLAAAHPNADDQAAAAMASSYTGTLTFAEETKSGIGPTTDSLGRMNTITLTLTPKATMCVVPASGCVFAAKDTTISSPPTLTDLSPTGNTMGGQALFTTSDTASGALSCGGSGQFTILTRAWSVVPTAWVLSWSGWSVTEVQYRITQDFASPQGRCMIATMHTVRDGHLHV